MSILKTAKNSLRKSWGNIFRDKFFAVFKMLINIVSINLTINFDFELFVTLILIQV